MPLLKKNQNKSGNIVDNPNICRSFEAENKKIVFSIDSFHT